MTAAMRASAEEADMKLAEINLAVARALRL